MNPIAYRAEKWKNGRKFNSPTTSRKAVCDFIGSVFIWHMYQPRSSSRTSRTCKNQALWSLCVTPILWFFVMTCVPMVRIVWVSTLNHATWKYQKYIYLNYVYIIYVCIWFWKWVIVAKKKRILYWWTEVKIEVNRIFKLGQPSTIVVFALKIME